MRFESVVETAGLGGATGMLWCLIFGVSGFSMGRGVEGTEVEALLPSMT